MKRRSFLIGATALGSGAGSRVLAQVNDDASLREALSDHLRFSAGFRTKFRTGFYSGAAGKEIGPAETAALVQRIADRLGKLSTSSLALVHHIPSDGHLRAWLIGADGLMAQHRSAEPYRRLGYLQEALGVDRKLDIRAPVRRDGKPLIAKPEVIAEYDGPDLVQSEALGFARGQLLGSQISDVLVAHRGRLVVLPVADTGTAPYAALPIGHFTRLVSTHSVVVIPDIETLVDPDRIKLSSNIRWDRLSLFGNPDLSSDPEFLFPPLPGAREEVETLAAQLAVPAERVAIGKDATLARFISQTARIDEGAVFHLASHAISNEINPMDGSFVGLTGGRLTGQILRSSRFLPWAVSHPLAILSGCQTALGKVFRGGTYGLARAFYSAGAAQVVSSLWSVDDRATASLMTEMVDRMQLTYPIEAALQKAQLKVAEAYPDDPGAWASFSVFGMPSER